MKSVKYIFSLIFLAFAQLITAQGEVTTTPAPEKTDVLKWALDNIFLVMAVLLIIIAVFIILKMMNMLMELQKIRFIDEHGLEAAKAANITVNQSLWQKIYKASTNYVPLEKESAVDLGHDYDGIRELDNSLPPWWLWMFYGTIIFAGLYMYWYHWSENGTTSIQRYEMAMEEGEKLKQVYLDKMADAINENVVVALVDQKDVDAGKEIFKKNCVACHLETGGGSVGPNLTDDYWIHGGGIKNMFKTIKYGVPEKGMISWATQLRPSEMQKVASYILTLRGTNPPNPKEPQGTLYTGEEAVPAQAVPEQAATEKPATEEKK